MNKITDDRTDDSTSETHPDWCRQRGCYDDLVYGVMHEGPVADDGPAVVLLSQGTFLTPTGVDAEAVEAALIVPGSRKADTIESLTADECRAAARALLVAADKLDSLTTEVA